MAVESHIVEWAGTYVDDVFKDVQDVVIGEVISAISPYVAWMAALYLVVLFLFAATGKREALKDGLWILGKIALVSAIGLNAAYLEKWLLMPINGFLLLISNAVSGADGLTVYGIADVAINKSLVVAEQAWDKAGDAGWRNTWIMIGWMAAGAFAGGGGLLMVGPCAIAIIASKGIISLLFMISPIFVIAAIFPVTAKYFLNWTAGVGNAIWIIILAALIMPLSTTMTAGLMSKLDIANGVAGPGQVITMSLFVAVLFWVIIIFIFNLASTLAGGLSMSMPVTSSNVGRGARAVTAAPFKWLGSKMSFGRSGGSVSQA